MSNIEFDVDRIAKLAMLDLTDRERALFTSQLPSILAYVSKLQEVDTSGVVTKSYLTECLNVFRADDVKEDLDTQKRVVNAFPASGEYGLEIPAIFE